MSHDIDDALAEHQFIAAALRKCPDAIHGGNTAIQVNRVKITEDKGVHTLEPADNLVHGAIVTFGMPEIQQSVFVFLDEAREEPMYMAHEYTHQRT